MSSDIVFITEPSVAQSPRSRQLLLSEARSQATRNWHRKKPRKARSFKDKQSASHVPHPTTNVSYQHIPSRSAELPNESGFVFTRGPAVQLIAPTKLLSLQSADNHQINHPGSCSSTAASILTQESDSLSHSTACYLLGCHPLYHEGLRLVNSPLPICPSSIRLNQEQASILRYFTSAWYPSEKHIPSGANTFGFTPLLSKDRRWASELVTEAIQASTNLHLNVLLAMTSFRMNYVHRITFTDNHAVEKYHGMAIKALRQHVASSSPVSSQLILDIAFLAQNEAYQTKGQASSPVYWQMIRRFIAICGGLRNIDEFVAHFCLSSDLSITVLTLTPPALDYRNDAHLLGLTMAETLTPEKAEATIAGLWPRLRTFLRVSANLTRVSNAIRHSGKVVPDKTLVYLRSNFDLIYRNVLTAVAVPRTISNDIPVSTQKSVPSDSSPQAIEAYNLLIYCRTLAYCIWAWLVAINFAEPGDPNIFDVSIAVADLHGSLERVLTMFSDTPWAIPNDLILWISSIGLLPSTWPRNGVDFTMIFRQALERSGITEQSQLEWLLSTHLPLDRIDATWSFRLWFEFAKRQRYSG